jgi:hypothetical protein
MRPATYIGTTVTWENLSAEEPEGEWQALGHLLRKTVTIEGGSVRLMGRNRSADAEGFDLTDAHGFPIKGPGLVEITACPWQLRPILVSGSSVTVTLVGTRGA